MEYNQGHFVGILTGIIGGTLIGHLLSSHCYDKVLFKARRGIWKLQHKLKQQLIVNRVLSTQLNNLNEPNECDEPDTPLACNNTEEYSAESLPTENPEIFTYKSQPKCVCYSNICKTVDEGNSTHIVCVKCDGFIRTLK